MEPDIKLIKKVPAPWKLTGDGYILVFKPSPNALMNQKRSFDPRLKFRGGYRYLMVVDYQNSDVGPYQELLYIPGVFKDGNHSYYVITTIFVSTFMSVENGRKNWGIPKQLAEAAIYKSENSTTVQFYQDQNSGKIAEFEFVDKSIKLPFTTALIPKKLRTLYQTYDQSTYITSPYGNGSLAMVNTKRLTLDQKFFPDLDLDHLILGLKAAHFHLVFPPADIRLERVVGK